MDDKRLAEIENELRILCAIPGKQEIKIELLLGWPKMAAELLEALKVCRKELKEYKEADLTKGSWPYKDTIEQRTKDACLEAVCNALTGGFMGVSIVREIITEAIEEA